LALGGAGLTVQLGVIMESEKEAEVAQLKKFVKNLNNVLLKYVQVYFKRFISNNYTAPFLKTYFRCNSK